MRYKIYSIEHGSSNIDPYDEDSRRDVAENVAKAMAEATHCRWFVFDIQSRRKIFMIDPNLQFANHKSEEQIDKD